MAQWVRGIFKTRSAPVVTEARAALVPPPSPQAPPEPSLWERVVHWRAYFAAAAKAAPTVDDVQARDAAEQRHRLDVGTDMIAKSIAERGCWFPHSDGPPRKWD